ncbi:hypothetical protein Peur_028193 [Populus x canadensis]
MSKVIFFVSLSMQRCYRDFSTVFTGRKCMICFHNMKLEITNEKCLIRGHVRVLPKRCPKSISFGAKRTDFIILKEVPMNVVDLNMDVTPFWLSSPPMMLPLPPALPTSPPSTP